MFNFVDVEQGEGMTFIVKMTQTRAEDLVEFPIVKGDGVNEPAGTVSVSVDEEGIAAGSSKEVKS